jgi:hypothetical protein
MTKRQIFLTNVLALYKASKQFDEERPNMWGVVTFNFWGLGRDRLSFKSGHEARVFVNKAIKDFRRRNYE